MHDPKFDALEGLSKELETAKEAVRILQNVWIECGPYGGAKLSGGTLLDLQRFFKFDDSE